MKKSVYQILRTSFPRRCLYLLHISVSTFKRLSLFAVYQSLGSLRTTLASLIRGEVLPIYFDSCVSTYLTRESRNEFGSKSSTLRLELELPDFELPMRETVSILVQLGVSKTNQVWKYFLHYTDGKMYPVHKPIENGLKIVYYCFYKFHRLVL